MKVGEKWGAFVLAFAVVAGVGHSICADRAIEFYSRNLNLRILAVTRNSDDNAECHSNASERLPWWQVAADEIFSIRLDLPKAPRKMVVGDMFSKVVLFYKSVVFFENGQLEFITGGGDRISGKMKHSRMRNRINKIWKHIVEREFVDQQLDGVATLEQLDDISAPLPNVESLTQRSDVTYADIWDIVRTHMLPFVAAQRVHERFDAACLDETEAQLSGQARPFLEMVWPDSSEDDDTDSSSDIDRSSDITEPHTTNDWSSSDDDDDYIMPCKERLAFSLLFDGVEVMIVLTKKISDGNSCETLWEYLKTVDVADTEIRYMGIVTSMGSVHIDNEEGRAAVWNEVVRGGQRVVRMAYLTAAHRPMCGCAIRFASDYQHVPEIAELIKPSDFLHFNIALDLENRLNKRTSTKRVGDMLNAIAREVAINKM